VLPRADGHFLVVFVKADNERITSFLDRFFELTGTPEAVSRRTVELWCQSPGSGVQPAFARDARVKVMRAQDEALVAAAAERTLGSLGATALSMMPGELGIPDTRKRYRKAGVERSRTGRLITRGEGAAYAVLHENSSAGFNLTWMLNASWVLPVHPELDHDGTALRVALDEVATQERTAAGDRFAIVPEGTDAETMRERGYHLVSAVRVNFYNRAGLQRWNNFLRETYGEIAAQRMSTASGIPARV
jgi:hypothetical protein